jgi:hypothetical protein
MSEKDIINLISELKQLKLCVILALSSLEALVLQSTENQGVIVPAVAPLPFQVGDTVVIIKKLGHPLNRPVSQGDRTKIVTKVAASRIDLITSISSTNWRVLHNLRAQLQDE